VLISRPTGVSPMLARGSRGVPVDVSAWSLEPKWDGWRCLARIDRGELRLTSVGATI
jgi:ATP-dependent DNA ligase